MVPCASSYGLFLGMIEFMSQCYIFFFCNIHYHLSFIHYDIGTKILSPQRIGRNSTHKEPFNILLTEIFFSRRDLSSEMVSSHFWKTLPPLSENLSFRNLFTFLGIVGSRIEKKRHKKLSVGYQRLVKTINQQKHAISTHQITQLKTY